MVGYLARVDSGQTTIIIACLTNNLAYCVGNPLTEKHDNLWKVIFQYNIMFEFNKSCKLTL
jgi:hypothetical protein